MFVKALKDFNFEVKKGDNIEANEGDILNVDTDVYIKLIKRRFCEATEESEASAKQAPKKETAKKAKSSKKDDSKVENKMAEEATEDKSEAKEPKEKTGK